MLMDMKRTIMLAIRGISFIGGVLILAWFGYLYMSAVARGYVITNFWYFTSSTTTNFMLALLFHFALCVLVGVSLYPGKTPVSFVLILIGMSCVAIGRAFTVPLVGFFYLHGINDPLGMALLLIGMLLLILGLRQDRMIKQAAPRSVPTQPADPGPGIG
jgi:hypothetical protein